MEVQLKGSGLTPYSRMGDGRAVLRSSIREYLCSEAMHALGIPTTRALAIVGSPLPVRRETVETAAVVTRVAPSFLRFGHFEHFAHTAQDEAALRRWPTPHGALLSRSAGPRPALRRLLQSVAERTASLLAQWQAVGFCHGVMNTDNMSMLGLTLDYGPFGFMDAFDPGHICNHTDQQGRYAYARQPQVAFWNLHALAQGLLPLIGDSDTALAALEPYKARFARRCWPPARQAGPARCARGRPPPGRRPAAPDGPGSLPTTPSRSAAWPASAPGPTRRANGCCATCSSTAPPSTPGRSATARAWQPKAATMPNAALRMNRVNPKYVLRNHLAEIGHPARPAGDFAESSAC
jgi:uncharacterized protein YdiU (UPF0061 family)